MTANEYERALKHGEAAFGYIKGNRTPAFPANYEFWYTYSCGVNRSLNDAVNAILKKFGRISPAEIQGFYEEFLSPVRYGGRIEEIGSMLAEEIGGVSDTIDSAIDHSGRYGDSLKGAAESLKGVSDPKSVASVVGRLFAATKEMEATNRELETKLIDSKTQINELQEHLEAIRFESLTDELTGIANRKHFDHSIHAAISEAESSGQPLSLLLFDIDHFKLFNDTHGHQTGDQVLRLVGHTLKSSVRVRDLTARYGGEEFAAILPDTALADAARVAEKIRVAIRGKELVKRSTGEMLGRVTMSFGAVTYRSGESAESLIHRADVCLYAAKGSGRDRVVTEDNPDIAALSKVA